MSAYCVFNNNSVLVLLSSNVCLDRFYYLPRFLAIIAAKLPYLDNLLLSLLHNTNFLINFINQSIQPINFTSHPPVEN